MKENHRRKQHSKKCKSKISSKRVLCPKIDSIIEKQNILTKSQSQNALYLSGYFYFALREVKLLISRQPLIYKTLIYHCTKIMFQKIILNDHLLHIYKQIYIEQVEEKNLIFSKINYQQLFLLYILPLKKLFQKSR